MNKRIAKIELTAVAFIVFSLAVPITSKAKVFWTETFENGLYPNWIGGGGCITADSPNGAVCGYPQITTSLAYEGTHSLWSHYVAGQQSGTFMDRNIPETTNLWTRQYVRFDNFVFGPENSKLFLTPTSDPSAAQVVWLNQDAGPELYPLVNLPTTETCPNGHSDITCNYYPNIAHIALNDNKWHCIETHQNLGTPNTADGLVELYVDGVLTTRYTNLLLRTSDHGTYIVRLYAQDGQGDRYQDDLAVGDTRIGCDGSPPALPAPPTGLTVK